MDLEIRTTLIGLQAVIDGQRLLLTRYERMIIRIAELVTESDGTVDAAKLSMILADE